MKIAITGAGIAGLTTAIALKKIGFEADVFEAAPSLEPVGAGLGLAPNALKALDYLGMADKVRRQGSRVNYFEIQNKKGDTLSKSAGADFGENICIHRAALHNVLLDELGPNRVFTNKKAVGFTNKGKVTVLEFEDGSTYEADYLIVADGIKSILRDVIAPQAKINYAGYTCWRAIMDNPGISVKGAVEIWDTKGRFGYVQLPDNKIFWFACINAPKGRQLSHFTLSDLQEHFAGFNSKVTAMLKHTDPAVLIYDDINDMAPLAKYAFGNKLLIGDAAHACTPNMGQGACQAIEDAVTLAKALAKRPSVERTFSAFERKRLARTHYIIKQSRKIGRMAQMQNPLKATLRDIFLRLAPKSLQSRQFKKLYKTEF
jgi:2-polyprenyl-6-methoxyphenol hydroxylase-like FAD-dependent oxidoreductase